MEKTDQETTRSHQGGFYPFYLTCSSSFLWYFIEIRQKLISSTPKRQKKTVFSAVSTRRFATAETWKYLLPQAKIPLAPLTGPIKRLAKLASHTAVCFFTLHLSGRSAEEARKEGTFVVVVVVVEVVVVVVVVAVVGAAIEEAVVAAVVVGSLSSGE